MYHMFICVNMDESYNSNITDWKNKKMYTGFYIAFKVKRYFVRVHTHIQIYTVKTEEW